MPDRTIPVVEETAEFLKQARPTARVILRTEPRRVTQPVEAEVTSETVEVERVPVGRFVEGPVPDRQEGDTLVISVLEEVLVVEKRLRVVEEVRLTRCRHTEHIRQGVEVRKDEVTIDRQPT